MVDFFKKAHVPLRFGIALQPQCLGGYYNGLVFWDTRGRKAPSGHLSGTSGPTHGEVFPGS